MIARLEPDGDGWVLAPLGELTQLRLDHEVTFVFETGVSLAAGTQLTLNSGAREIDPEQSQDAAPLLDLIHRSAHRLTVSATGDLTLEFEDGTTISVAPDSEFEAFELNAPPESGFTLLVCAPDGSISIWD
jgi:hypothetical protein